jgi:hypothetical protein
MKRKLTTILSVEALVFLLACIFNSYLKISFTSIIAFPFEQLGTGLRTISLSGTTGNYISIVIYLIICLLPSAYLVYRLLKRRSHIEDWLLALLSMVLFWVIYVMINPVDITRHFGSSEILDTSKAFLGVVVYSIAAGYLVLRIMRSFTYSSSDSILKYLKLLLAVICVVLVYGIFGSGLMKLISAFGQLSSSNTGAGQGLGLSYAFLILQYLVSILPLALEIIIIYAGLKLIEAFKKDPYGQDVVTSAQKISDICRRSVVLIMLTQICVNVLQLILGSSVRSSHYTLSIPLMSVVLVLIVMLSANYFEQARQLKNDNDMFI